MNQQSSTVIFAFGAFRLDVTHRLLLRDTGQSVPLTPKATELLLILVESEGRLLTKAELMNKLWPESFVEEGNLTQTVSLLRKALGDNPQQHQYIVTVPGRGYRFVAEVHMAQVRESEEDKWDETLLEESSAPQAQPEISNAKSQIANFKTASPKPIETASPKLKPKIRLFWLAVPLVALLALGIFLFYQKTKPAELGAIKTIAILPFQNTGAHTDQEYLGQGLAEVLITKLSRVRTIIVRPTSSVVKFAEASPNPQKIGSELNVEAIVTGRVQRIDDKIRVTAQLVRTSDGATLWADTFDDKFTNIFALQDSISMRVTESLAVKLGQDERRQLAKNYTANTEAFQFYLHGTYLWSKRTPETLLNAIREFEKAKEIDPNYALAYIGLSNCYVVLSNYGVMTPHEAFPKAKEYIKKALEIDEQLAEAHAALAEMQVYYDWNWTEAEKSFKRSLELNPNYATTHQWYAEFLFDMRRFDESFAEYDRAMQIEPRALIILTSHAARFLYLRQYDKVIELTGKIHEIDPNYGYSYYHLGLAYEQKGMDKETAEAFYKTMTLLGEPPDCVEEVRAAFNKGGLRHFWEVRLRQFETRPHLKNYPPAGVASIHARLGNKEKTLELLEQGYQKRDPWMVTLNIHVHFDLVADDPRFQDLLRRMNFTNL